MNQRSKLENYRPRSQTEYDYVQEGLNRVYREFMKEMNKRQPESQPKK